MAPAPEPVNVEGDGPVRVAFVIPTFPHAHQTFIVSQLDGLVRLGHEVVVYARVPEPDDEDPEAEERLARFRRAQPDLPERRLPRTRAGLRLALRVGRRHPRLVCRALDPVRFGRYALSFATLQAAAPLLDRPRFDIVHCHFGPAGVLGAMLQDMDVLRGPLVVTFYGHDVTRYPLQRGAHVYRRLFARAERILALDPAMRDRLRDLGAPAERLDLQPLSVDCTRFTPGPGPTAPAPLQLLSIGRLVEKKGFATAILAVARLARDGHDVRYRIAGDGPLDPVLRRLVEDLGVEDVVELVGRVRHDDVAALMASAHAMIVPSVRASDGDEEGTPTVILEAMACGLPVAATRHAGIPDLITDGETGLLVEERDPDGLARCVARLADRGLADRLGSSARAAALRRFETDRVTRRLVDHYEAMLGGPGHS
jgi:colanic acid/amylovoran biosynthesis glycosyltransferase